MYQGPDKIDSENQSSSTLLQLMFAKTLSHSVNSNRNNREEAKAKRPSNLVLQSFNWLYRLTTNFSRIFREFAKLSPSPLPLIPWNLCWPFLWTSSLMTLVLKTFPETNLDGFVKLWELLLLAYLGISCKIIPLIFFKYASRGFPRC